LTEENEVKQLTLISADFGFRTASLTPEEQEKIRGSLPVNRAITDILYEPTLRKQQTAKSIALRFGRCNTMEFHGFFERLEEKAEGLLRRLDKGERNLFYCDGEIILFIDPRNQRLADDVYNGIGIIFNGIRSGGHFMLVTSSPVIRLAALVFGKGKLIGHVPFLGTVILKNETSLVVKD